MEFDLENVPMKSGRRHLTDGMKLPNQDKIRTLGEKETDNYMGILEPDTIKQVERKKKTFRKNISGQPESYLKQNYVAETLSKK